MVTLPRAPRELEAAWRGVLGHLQFAVSRHSFSTWLEGTRALRIEDGTLIVEARSSFNCDWLNHQLSTVVQRAVADFFHEAVPVIFVPRGADGDAGLAALLPGPAVSPARPSAAPVVGRLNVAFTFDRYLPGSGNRLAFQCCLSLFDREPGQQAISPVVIFGAPGMGKTHLLHAVAARAVAENLSVACLSAEEFTNRYLAAIRGQDVEQFQLSVRSARVLVIDDLQYLAGKKGTQDELVHTIDAVTNGGGHVIVASETHPLELNLPDRLASRLAAGIVTRVDPFMAAERRSFIESQGACLGATLPAWAIDRIAGAEVPSVRLLQGAVNAVISLQRCDMLDLAGLDDALSRLAIAEVSPASASDRAVLEAVGRYFEISFDELVGRSRKPSLAGPRAAVVALLRDRGRSNAEIAAILGGRDRTTVSALLERGRALLAEHASLRKQLA